MAIKPILCVLVVHEVKYPGALDANGLSLPTNVHRKLVEPFRGRGGICPSGNGFCHMSFSLSVVGLRVAPRYWGTAWIPWTDSQPPGGFPIC